MAINFPDSPTQGELYSASNGVVYTYDSVNQQWVVNSGQQYWVKTGDTLAPAVVDDSVLVSDGSTTYVETNPTGVLAQNPAASNSNTFFKGRTVNGVDRVSLFTDGTALFSSKITTALTTGSDSDGILTTKSYVDAKVAAGGGGDPGGGTIGTLQQVTTEGNNTDVGITLGTTNIVLNNDGSAAFANGDIDFYTNGSAIFKEQVSSSNSYFTSNRTSGATQCFEGTLNNIQTSVINADGSGTFVGDIVVGTAATGINLGSNGSIQISNGSGPETVLNVDGSASFADGNISFATDGSITAALRFTSGPSDVSAGASHFTSLANTTDNSTFHFWGGSIATGAGIPSFSVTAAGSINAAGSITAAGNGSFGSVDAATYVSCQSNGESTIYASNYFDGIRAVFIGTNKDGTYTSYIYNDGSISAVGTVKSQDPSNSNKWSALNNGYIVLQDPDADSNSIYLRCRKANGDNQIEITGEGSITAAGEVKALQFETDPSGGGVRSYRSIGGAAEVWRSGLASDNITCTIAANGSITAAGNITAANNRIKLGSTYIADPPSTGNSRGILFGSDGVLPCDGNGATSNGTYDLGADGSKWDNLYLSGTTQFSLADGSTLDAKDAIIKAKDALQAIKAAALDNSTDLAGLKAAIVAALADH